MKRTREPERDQPVVAEYALVSLSPKRLALQTGIKAEDPVPSSRMGFMPIFIFH